MIELWSKKCSSCKEILEYSNFSKNRSKNDGFSSECKKCMLSLNYKVECECGAKICKYYKKYHMITSTHKINMEGKQINC